MSGSAWHRVGRGASRCIWVAAACLVVTVSTTRAVAPAHRNSGEGNPSPGTSFPAHYLNTDPSVAYVGDEACKTCHAKIYNTFKQTGMGRSMARPSSSDELGEFRKSATIQTNVPGRLYSSFVKDDRFFHRELQTDQSGKTEFSDTREVAYAVGSGHLGRSYLVANGDYLFLSPLSYYFRPGKWDLSPGYEQNLYQGFSRPIVDLCVYCHAGLPQPVPGTLNRFERPPFKFLAIGCERCHGPGELHVRQRNRGDTLQGERDSSIVNPAKLSLGLRDNVCEQCHLAGDARVLRPGKSFVDFRPGMALDDVVAIFSVPTGVKGTGPEAISQAVQMKMSRCWIGSSGKLGCITCHDPHVQPGGAQTASYFRDKCLSCHTLQSCRLDMKIRLATSPPDHCIGCHMPQRPLTTIAHAALTDHRILRRPSGGSQTLHRTGLAAEFQELIHETARPDSPASALDLRTQALAYAQVAENYPVYAQPGWSLLERAARQFPNDPEVQSTFGLALLEQSQSNERQRRAADALERAITLHSTSPVVRIRLAELKLQGGYLNGAITLLDQAIEIEPYYAPAHLALARDYLLLGERKSAIEVLQRILLFDPGNESARKELEEARVVQGR